MDEIARLRQMAEGVASLVPDLPAALARDIRQVADSPADPWLLAGVLLEGLAHVIRTAIPPELRQDCAAAAMRMLAQRAGLGG
jgi:hypothetical protein